MEVSRFIYGGGPFTLRLQAGTTISNAGVPVTASTVATTDLAMVEPMPASAASQIAAGLALDTTGTISATPASGTDLLVAVECRPDVVIQGRMSGGATSGTALSTNATTSAQSDGTSANGVTTIDDSAIWGYDGANAGVLRRADDASGSVAIAFPKAIASGDNFLVANGYPFGIAGASANNFLDLTSDLTEFDASATVTDTDNFVILDILARSEAEEGTTNSFYLVVFNDHALAGNAQRS